MAKVQSRRAVSFNRDLFKAVTAESARDGLSTSHWVAKLVRAELEKRGRSLPAQWFDPPRRVAPPKSRERLRSVVADLKRGWGMT